MPELQLWGKQTAASGLEYSRADLQVGASIIVISSKQTCQ